MATNIEMPQMGFDMHEGTVVKWRKNEGDEVSRGEIIAEIQTDKAVVEMEAYASGILRKVTVKEGASVPVGTLIAIIASPDEDLTDLHNQEMPSVSSVGTTDQEKVTAPRDSKQPHAESSDKPSEESSTNIKASPIAKRLSRELGVDLAKVKGTGPGGRITEDDVKNYPQDSSPASIPSSTKVTPAQGTPLSKMRQAIANSTVRSKTEAPHFYVTSEIDMQNAIEIRRELNQDLGQGTRISVNDLIIKACVIAIKKFPNFNARYSNGALIANPNINMGIAIALDQGLIIASIPSCQTRDLVNIAQASKDLIKRAHGGILKAEEYTGSTFTISNLGMFDVDSFSAIIFPPNAAVLAVGSIKEQPIVRDGAISIGQILKVTISVDHRVVDGAEAAQFVREVKRSLENPKSLIS